MIDLDKIKKCIIKILENDTGCDDEIASIQNAKKIEEIENVISMIKNSDLSREILLCFNKYKEE
ncbi:MAG: hypothetical protein ACI7YS_18360 [Flavobacterium sp.]